MEQTIKPAIRSKRKLKSTDSVFLAVIVLIVAALLISLHKQLALKAEVSSAKVIANRLSDDIRQENPADALSVSDASFKQAYSATELGSLFSAANSYAKGTPSIASQIVTNTKDSQNVGFVYKYTGDKTAYFIRIVLSKVAGATSWQLAGISGGNNQAALENNKD